MNLEDTVFQSITVVTDRTPFDGSGTGWLMSSHCYVRGKCCLTLRAESPGSAAAFLEVGGSSLCPLFPHGRPRKLVMLARSLLPLAGWRFPGGNKRSKGTLAGK